NSASLAATASFVTGCVLVPVLTAYPSSWAARLIAGSYPMAKIHSFTSPLTVISNARVFFGGFAGTAASASSRVANNFLGSSSRLTAGACVSGAVFSVVVVVVVFVVSLMVVPLFVGQGSRWAGSAPCRASATTATSHVFIIGRST